MFTKFRKRDSPRHGMLCKLAYSGNFGSLGMSAISFLDVPRLFLAVRRSKTSTNAPFICNHRPPDLGDGAGWGIAGQTVLEKKIPLI